MAKYLRRRGDSLAPFCICLYFLIRWQVSTELNVNKGEVRSNDFDVSIGTINGKVHVNWNAMSFWQNTTVYFLSHLYDEARNSSYSVNISVCHAVKLGKNSWEMEPTKGSLLEFCNKSKHCSLVETKSDSLVSATVNEDTQGFSCQLFTTCTNFESIFRIQVISFGKGKEYSFQSRNMSIYSENLPPVSKTSTFGERTSDTSVALNIDYVRPSELCGFGSNPSHAIQFVVNCYKTNDTGCFYMGQRAVPINETEVKFEGKVRETDVIYFYLTVKSLTNNKTTTSQRFTLASDGNDYTYSAIGGVLSISWRPRWNCFSENIIEQALYCFEQKYCFPVCEVSFFANGTFRGEKTFDDEIIEACERDSSCSVETSESMPLITVSWSPENRRIGCTFFKTCLRNQLYKVKLMTLNDGGTSELNDRDVATDYQVDFVNVPATPLNVTATDIKENQVTITWKSRKCDIDFAVDIFLIINDEEIKITNSRQIVRKDNTYLVYNYTKTGLRAYQEIKFQAYAKSDYNRRKSPHSPWKTVRTKPSVPDSDPILTNIQSEDREIVLTWQLPAEIYLNGLPNETRIIGRDENYTLVFYDTFYDMKQTTASFVIHNETQRCAYYQVKFCNAPRLCSNYSHRLRLPECVGGTRTRGTVPRPPSSSSGIIWIVISVSIAIFLVVIISAAIIYVYYRKKKLQSRPVLPALAMVKDHSGDYIPVELPGEYDRLDKEDCLDELIT